MSEHEDDIRARPNKGIADEFATSTTRLVNQTSDELPRTNSLDALRGWAIFGMALSGMIPFGILPKWMYHCQVPPPDHVFNPKIFGITWVDLVFPFFLFSMGAAMPLALHKFGTDGKSSIQLIFKQLGRFIMLGFFAYWIEITRYSNQTKDPGAWLTVVMPAYFILFLIFWKPPKSLPTWIPWVSIPIGFAGAWMLVEPIIKSTLVSKSAVFGCDIILAVLANVAFFGGLLVYLTRSVPWFRWILVVATAWMFVNKGFPTFLYEALSLIPKFKMIHQPEFLKYLIIILIGSLFGDMTMKWPVKLKSGAESKPESSIEIAKSQLWLVCGIAVFLTIMITALLFWRKSVDALVVSLVFGSAILGIVWKWPSSFARLNIQWVLKSLITLVIGLILEISYFPIQKDPTSVSYFFVTAGLAGFLLLSFQIIDQMLSVRLKPGLFALVGQNALLAYATITHLAPIIWKKSGFENLIVDFTLKHLALGFARGLSEAMLVMVIVAVLTKMKLHLRA